MITIPDTLSYVILYFFYISLLELSGGINRALHQSARFLSECGSKWLPSIGGKETDMLFPRETSNHLLFGVGFAVPNHFDQMLFKRKETNLNSCVYLYVWSISSYSNQSSVLWEWQTAVTPLAWGNWGFYSFQPVLLIFTKQISWGWFDQFLG